MGLSNDIWTAYIGYLLYRPLFQMLITVASFEIARQIKSDCCGLVFGVNTFFALAFQTLLTVVVVEWIGLPPKEQVKLSLLKLLHHLRNEFQHFSLLCMEYIPTSSEGF